MRIYHKKARRHEDFLRLRSQKATAVERRTGAKIPQYFPGAIKVDAASIHPKRLPSATATLRVFATSCEQFCAGGADERRYCVAEGGEYEFALTKGVEYSLAVSWDCGVEFSWRDGAGADGAGAVEFEQVGGAARGLDTAARRWRLMWRPFIATDPATVYWNLDDPQPVRIEAEIELSGEFSCRWSSGANAARRSNYKLYNTPIFDMDTVAWRDVMIHPCEIVSEGETPRMTNGDIAEMLRSVNEIYRQVGMRFSAADLMVVTNSKWDTEGLLVKDSRKEICNSRHISNGLEIYFITGQIDGYDNRPIAKREPSGITSSGGIVVKKAANFRTLAHELGHACGWADIYASIQTGEGADMQTVTLSEEENKIVASSVPSDWGFYPRELTQSNLIKRLLMYGIHSDSRGDIPSGSIFGLGKYPDPSSNFSGMLNVGINGFFISQPHSN